MQSEWSISSWNIHNKSNITFFSSILDRDLWCWFSTAATLRCVVLSCLCCTEVNWKCESSSNKSDSLASSIDCWACAKVFWIDLKHYSSFFELASTNALSSSSDFFFFTLPPDLNDFPLPPSSFLLGQQWLAGCPISLLHLKHFLSAKNFLSYGGLVDFSSPPPFPFPPFCAKDVPSDAVAVRVFFGNCQDRLVPTG
jgi:hypothetical protein